MKKNILICPLNWGLGHATRCVPIIRALLEQGHNVIMAADKAPLAFLKKEFPDLETVEFPGFDPRYSKSSSQVFKMMMSFPKALFCFRKDHKMLESIIKSHNIDIVISDNRFGCWSKEVYSVFITHQLHIRIPFIWRWATPIINIFNNSYIKKYDEVWVPDDDIEPSLGGKLSHPAIKGVKTSYIGYLSRFKSTDYAEIEKTNRYLVILSGPEPQRTIFENIVLQQAKNINDNVVIFRAKPDSDEQLKDIPNNVKVYNHVDDATFVKMVNNSEYIICRGGYTSLMDLVRLNRTAFLVPTPGQTEQEYLARHLGADSDFEWCKQSDFQLAKVSSAYISTREKYRDNESIIEDFIQIWTENLN